VLSPDPVRVSETSLRPVPMTAKSVSSPGSPPGRRPPLLQSRSPRHDFPVYDRCGRDPMGARTILKVAVEILYCPT